MWKITREVNNVFVRKFESSVIRLASTAPIQSSNVPDVPQPSRSGLQASYARGTGGRLSFSGNVCTIFGASGFLGIDVVNALAKDGTQIIIPYRGDPYDVRHLKLCGDLGQILFFPFNLKDEESIRKVVRHSNVVINLIGRNYPTVNFSVFDANAEGARRIARISREMNVKRFIQFSSINATEHPKEVFIPDGSTFLRSKALAEKYVREEFPESVIVRPTNIYTSFDKFFITMTSPFRRNYLTRMSLYRKGEHTFKSPVYRVNVASGVLQIVRDPTTDGKTYEFCGPHWYKLSDLVDWTFRVIQRYDLFTYGRQHYECFFTMKVNFFMLTQLFSRREVLLDWDYLERTECLNDTLTGCPTLEDLGVALDVIEDKVPQTLRLQNRAKAYKGKIGEFPEPPWPKRYAPILMPDYKPASQRYQTDINTSFNFSA